MMKGSALPREYRGQIAINVRALREKHNLTIPQLARAVYVDPDTLYALEMRHTTHNPSLPVLLRIADYFRCSLDLLCGRYVDEPCEQRDGVDWTRLGRALPDWEKARVYSLYYNSPYLPPQRESASVPIDRIMCEALESTRQGSGRGVN